MVIYIKDRSNSNELVSVEVDKEFYTTILQQINLKNKRTTPVNKMDSSKDFLNMVSGGNCKCQCLCCDETTPPPPTTTTPPPTTERPPPSSTTRRVTSTTTRGTTTSTTTERPPPPPTTTTTPPTTTTKPPPSTTTPQTTTRPNPTTIFVGPTYLPPTRGPTTKRPPTTTRTYGTFTQYFTARFTGTRPTYSYRIRASTRTPPTITVSPKYAYYKPRKQFYYPGEGLQVIEDGKIVYAVEPIKVDQSFQPKVPKNKWNFLS